MTQPAARATDNALVMTIPAARLQASAPVALAAPDSPVLVPAAERHGLSFRETLQAQAAQPPPPVPATRALRETSVELLNDVARGERYMRTVIREAAAGVPFSPQQLIAIQAGVYRYTQELELVSKVVDKGTSAVKTTLQSQGS